jgi:hypothetical protein
MPVTVYHLAWWRRWLARPFVRVGLRALFSILAPVKITGRENVPLGKAYIVAINHVSIFDPPFAGVFWPEQVEAMGAVEVWSRPGQNILARLWGGIQVHRGDYDRAMSPLKVAVPMCRDCRLQGQGSPISLNNPTCRSSRPPSLAQPMISGKRPLKASDRSWNCALAKRSIYHRWKAKARRAAPPASAMPTW